MNEYQFGSQQCRPRIVFPSGPVRPGPGGRLLAFHRADAGHLHGQPRRLPDRGEDADHRAVSRGACQTGLSIKLLA